MSKATSHQTNVGVNDNWETPQELFNVTCKKLKINPTLDVCATDTNHKLGKYFTLDDNALTKEWTESFFMNPPYSQINAWMDYAYKQHQKHNVDALILVFAKTSVKWWHKYVEGRSQTHFHKGRIRFLIDGIEPRYCTKCKTRFIENINFCKTCVKCTVCKESFLTPLEKCSLCSGETTHRKIGKSSPTYDSVWIVYKKTDKICKSCDVNPIFDNGIVCQQCHESCKPEVVKIV